MSAPVHHPLPEGELPPPSDAAGWRQRLHEIIFESDTPAGKAFDVALLIAIFASVMAVVLESVEAVRAEWGFELLAAEWLFTVLFTIEYGLRLISVERPGRYARSTFGIIDLLAILPTWISLFVPGAHPLLVVRAFRLLRVFRILKLAHFLGEAETLTLAMRASMRKILVFLGFLVIVVLIVGTTMYLIEPRESGFTSIPMAVYWAIVTMTTVGYGDIVPTTVPGRILAAVLMICGYGILAVPTGIVTVELSRRGGAVSGQACPGCGAEGHEVDARFCRYCGSGLSVEAARASRESR